MRVSELYESNETAWELIGRGKVRDVYEYRPNEMLIVTSDRLSAFDVVLPTPIPDKGVVLTQIANFWFDKTSPIIANHVIDPEPFSADPARRHLAGRSIVVHRARALPVEAIVRGYLTGSGRKDYEKSGAVCGIALPTGLVEASRLPEPLFTPSTKANWARTTRTSRSRRMADLVGASWQSGCATSRSSCIASGRPMRWSGASSSPTPSSSSACSTTSSSSSTRSLTPDSSRFWPADGYQAGGSQPSYDKQFVRDYLETLDWDKTAPGPALPADVVAKTSAKYQEAWRRLTQE